MIVANLVLALHAGWVLFNVLAPIWAWRRPWLRAAHLAALGLTLLFAAVLGGCPVTELENRLRLRANPAAAYPGGFIGHYLWRVVYWDLPASWLNAAAAAWAALWGAVYARLWKAE